MSTQLRVINLYFFLSFACFSTLMPMERAKKILEEIPKKKKELDFNPNAAIHKLR